jgi:hypothetical protein
VSGHDDMLCGFGDKSEEVGEAGGYGGIAAEGLGSHLVVGASFLLDDAEMVFEWLQNEARAASI